MSSVLLITGAGRSIGAATAHRAARRGFPVAVDLLSKEEAAMCVVREAEQAGARSVAVGRAVADAEDLEALFDAADRLGTLLRPVNNAGVVGAEIHASSGDPGRDARMASGLPMARAGTADEAARANLFRLPEDAAYATGSIIPVSGGRGLTP